MRKTASEIIRNLEVRVARLESAHLVKTSGTDPSFVWPLGSLHHEDAEERRRDLQRLLGNEYRVWLTSSVGDTQILHVAAKHMSWPEFAMAFRDDIYIPMSDYLKSHSDYKNVNPAGVQRMNRELMRHISELRTASWN